MKKNEQTREGGCGGRGMACGHSWGLGGNVARVDEGVPRNTGTRTQDTPSTRVPGEGRTGHLAYPHMLQ